MKIKLILTAVSVILLLVAFSSTNAQTDLTKLKYFKIDVVTSDDILFVKLQQEAGIEPLMSTFELVVNILSDNENSHYAAFGNDELASTPRVAWDALSKEIRDGLLQWSKPNKVSLEKNNCNK